MKGKRLYAKSAERTPQQAAELKAVRDHYQTHKPTLDEALAAAGQTEPVPLAAVLELHAVLSQLRLIRIKKRLTLKQMEQRTGIKQSALSRLETGRTDNPTVATVGKIARALGKRVTCQLVDD